MYNQSSALADLLLLLLLGLSVPLLWGWKRVLGPTAAALPRLAMMFMAGAFVPLNSPAVACRIASTIQVPSVSPLQ
jgi:hypothetical protein